MKKFNISAVLLLSLCFSSCSSFLEEDTKHILSTDQFYKSESDARQAINGVYSTFKSIDVTGYNMRTMPTDLTKRATWDEGGGLINYSFTSDNTWIENMWVNHYVVIKDCNSAIGRITANKENIDNWERYVAQARAVRAFLYFDLVRWFGDVPLVVKETTSLVSNLDVPRNPKSEVFQQIIDDFQYCVDYSMDKDDTANGYQYGRFTTGAAKAFLAKVHLWLGSVANRDGEALLGSAEENFQQAMDLSKEIIDGGLYQLVEYYPDVFNAKTKNGAAMNEVMMVTVGANGDGTGSFTGMMLGLQGDDEYGASWGNITGSDYHRTMYEPTDTVRRLWNCPRVTIQSDGSLYGFDYPAYYVDQTGNNDDLTEEDPMTNYRSWTIGKFRRYPVADLASYNYNNFGMNEPLLRYSDVLLTYAEAYNEVHQGPGTATPSASLDLKGNGIVSAYDAVNVVRKRARYGTQGSDIHADILPRVMNYAAVDAPGCVADWSAGSYGLDSQGADIYAEREYGSDYEAFRMEILNERAREFVGETTDRWCDLVRRGLLVSVMQTAWRTSNPFIAGATERNIDAVSAPENIREYHQYLPIPLRELDTNKALVQNPGY